MFTILLVVARLGQLCFLKLKCCVVMIFVILYYLERVGGILFRLAVCRDIDFHFFRPNKDTVRDACRLLFIQTWREEAIFTIFTLWLHTTSFFPHKSPYLLSTDKWACFATGVARGQREGSKRMKS